MAVNLVRPDWLLIVPELIVLATAFLILAGDVLLPSRRHFALSIVAIVGQALALASLLLIDWKAGKSTFTGMFHADYFSLFVDIVVLAAGIMSVLISTAYVVGRDEPGNMPLPEYLALLLFSILGAMLVGAAGDLVMIFIGIEMSSLAVYALTGFARNRTTSIEGALKYFLLGAFASAILIYGMAWIYGVTGTTGLSAIAQQLRPIVSGSGPVDPALLLALLLLAIGLGFKIAAVPFHMWTPDAYQGAPTPVSGYMSVVPKVAGFAALARVMVEALGPMSHTWLILIEVLAVLTMVYGNVVAVVQRDVKRMLGYSSIGHTGYMLVALAAFSGGGVNDRSVGSLLFYLFAYAFMNIGAFGVVTWLQHREHGVDLDDFYGLALRSPLAAVAMTIFMLSLMGMPPLIGFYAKYYVILAAIQANLIWLAVVVVLMSAVSAFFYLRVVAVMWFNEPVRAWTVEHTPMLGLGLALMAIGTIGFGLFSGPVLDLAQNWAQAFFLPV
ncbi:MAG TPA: NADH-quinone oxidoreductase subunit N [Thermomicrobiaceae bacterium]|nr:NADH-quinone oxidoreductase subunit N [Thermomicrobiaceae bacterium]